MQKLEETGQDLELEQALRECLSNAYMEDNSPAVKLNYLAGKITEFQNLCANQGAWAARLAQNNVELSGQLAAANRWGHSLETELQKLNRTR